MITMTNDTVNLLRECNAGIKMGILSIDEMLGSIRSEALGERVKKSREVHCKLGAEAAKLLEELEHETKEPPAMAKIMSWMKTNVKLTGDAPDRTVADLLTDGCNMGVKTLYRYLNQYPDADEKSKFLVRQITAEEEALAKYLRDYL